MKPFVKPRELIATVLGVAPESLQCDAAGGVHPKWDSFNQLGIIVAIELSYGVSLVGNDAEHYSSLEAIGKLYDALTHKSA